MAQKILKVSISTEYVEGAPNDTKAINLVNNALASLLSNDYDRVRVLQYCIQRINDKHNAEMSEMAEGQMAVQGAPDA